MWDELPGRICSVSGIVTGHMESLKPERSASSISISRDAMELSSSIRSVLQMVDSSEETDADERANTEKEGGISVFVGRQEHDAMETELAVSMPIDIALELGWSGCGDEEGRSCACPEHAHGPIKNPELCPHCHHQC